MMVMGVVAVVLLASGAVAVQPAAPARPGSAPSPAAATLVQPAPVDPLTAWGEIARAYQRGPTHDRVEVTARFGTQSRQAMIDVMIDPAAGDRGGVRIEAGPLVVWADDGGLAAHLVSNPGVMLVRPMEGGLSVASMGRALPPMPLPQVALWKCAPGESPAGLVPWVGGGGGLGEVRWVSAEADDVRTSAPALRVMGHSVEDARVTVAVTADLASGRLRSVVMNLTPDPQGAERRVEMQVRAMADPSPSDVAAWRLSRRGRVEVSDLADLSRSPRELAVGTVLRAGWGVADRVVMAVGPLAREEFERVDAVVSGAWSAVQARREATERRPLVRVWLVESAALAATPGTPWAYNPALSACYGRGRAMPEGGVVLAKVDAQGVVRAVAVVGPGQERGVVEGELERLMGK